MVVKINNNYSDEFITQSGVPQGSNLGPLLYLIQVISLSTVTSKCKMFNFADDTVIIAAHPNLAQAEIMMQNEFDLIQRWVHDHALILNETKTTCMHVRPPTKLSQKLRIKIHSHNCLHITTTFGNTCDCNTYATQITNQKYLGIIIDDAFSWGLILKIFVTGFVRAPLAYLICLK